MSVGIPRTRARNHPHEFSGGMRQRIMIALAIALRPGVIVADEPTTALDVVVEAQILELLDRLRREEQLGLILITHNLGIVAETADRVAVMYAGRIVEEGPVEAVFARPAHPYTQGLLASVISLETTELRSIDGDPPDLVDPPTGCRFRLRCPYAFAPVRVDGPDADRTGRRSAGRLPAARRGGRLGRTGAPVSAAEVPRTNRCHGEPALVVEDLTVRFDLGGGLLLAQQGAGAGGRRRELRRPPRRGVRARRRVRFGQDDAWAGRCSGSCRRSSGSIRWQGTELVGLTERQLRPMRRRLAMVFQDPNASLNPAMTIGQGVGHPLRIHGLTSNRSETRQRVAEMLERCGLTPPERYLDVYPEDLSGGQKQRAVLARALITDPDLVVADEPVAALDMSVRAKVLDLLMQLREELDLTCLYITHDLASGKFVCDRLAIMYLGRFVEWGASDRHLRLAAAPLHPGVARRAAAARPEPQGSRQVAARAARSPTRVAPPVGLPVPPALPVRVRRLRLGGSRRGRRHRGPLGRRRRAHLRVRARAGRRPRVGEVSTVSRCASPGAAAPSGSGPGWPRSARPCRPRCSSAVEAVEADGGDVVVRLAEHVAPGLQEVEGRLVACHLHGIVPR